MRKHAVRLVAIFLFALFLSLSFVDCATAQDFVETIESPVAGETINGNSVNLNFSVARYHFWPVNMSYKVYLDGELCNQSQQTMNNRWTNSVYTSLTLDLTNLTQGEHTIKVDVNLQTYLSVIFPFIFTYNMPASVDFFVYRGIQPQVSILGFDVYKTNQTIFNITTNERGSAVSYSLDGEANVTLPQNESATLLDLYTYNVTLSDLPIGFHTLTAYAKDVFNQTAVVEKTFAVPPSLPTITIIVAIAIAVVCAVALLLKKRGNPFKSKT
jgi:hypothetical protein